MLCYAMLLKCLSVFLDTPDIIVYYVLLEKKIVPFY
jgi:hypothetical protein